MQQLPPDIDNFTAAARPAPRRSRQARVRWGDRLVTVLHVDSVTERAGLSMVTTRAVISAADGEPVATVTSTLAVRGEDA